jgi:hypothetical protein
MFIYHPIYLLQKAICMENGNITQTLSLQVSQDYKSFLQEIKKRIKNARLKAALSVNLEIIKFYWEIGNLIIEKQKVPSGVINLLKH